MPKFEMILHNPQRLCALTGLKHEQFASLLPAFDRTMSNYLERYTLDGYVREGQRAITYANSPLPSSADRLLFILTYLKQNPTQTVQAQMFEMTQSNVSKWVAFLLERLSETLRDQQVLPARTATELSAMWDDHPFTPSQLAEHEPAPLFTTMEPNVP